MRRGAEWGNDASRGVGGTKRPGRPDPVGHVGRVRQGAADRHAQAAKQVSAPNHVVRERLARAPPHAGGRAASCDWSGLVYGAAIESLTPSNMVSSVAVVVIRFSALVQGLGAGF